MTEVLGGAASLVSIADASIRSCLVIFRFFSALHHAEPEFQRHVIVIQDIHDAVQVVRKTTNSQCLTEASKGMMDRQLNSIAEELSALKKTISGNDPSKLNVKMKWILKKTETDQVLQRLESHKTSLMLLLDAINLEQSSRIRISQSSSQSHLQTVESLVGQKHEDDMALRSDIQRGFDNLVTNMDSNFRLYKESLEAGFSTLNRDHKIVVPEEHLANVLHHVLETHISSRVEENLAAKSESQNATTLREVRTIISNATGEILKHIDDKINKSEIPGSRDKFRPSGPTLNSQNWSSASAVPRPSTSVSPPAAEECHHAPSTVPAHLPRNLSLKSPSNVTKWSYWTPIPCLGILRLEYQVHAEPRGRSWTIKIDFWPSIILLAKKCISLKYSSRRDQQGYVALCPTLATRPILSTGDAIWGLIKDDNIPAIISRFQNGQNGPFDQDSRGVSLLISALDHRSYKVAQFLLSQGADPTQTTACGGDGLNALVTSALYHAIVSPQPFCCYSYDLVKTELSWFFAIYYSLLDHGCDLDDCTVTVYEFLQDSDFADNCYNEWDDDEEVREIWCDNEIMTEDSIFDSDTEAYQCSDTCDGDQSIDDNASFIIEPSDQPDPQALIDYKYLNGIHQLTQFLSLHGLKLLRERPDLPGINHVINQPQRMTLAVLWECGLDYNYNEPHREYMKPILYGMLHSFLEWLDQPDSNPSLLLRNLVSLIESGANIYDVEWVPKGLVDGVEEDACMSPTAYAQTNNLMAVWKFALRVAGYDPEQVILEDERNRQEFRRFHGARSSAVEIPEDRSVSTIRRRLV